MAEYTSDAFGGAMQGDLIFAQFQLFPGGIGRAVLSADGTAVTVSTLASGYDMPLDVTVGPTGIIYIAEYGGGDVAYLEPQSTTATAQPTSATPTATAMTATATPTAAGATVTPGPSATPTATSLFTPTATLGSTPTPASALGDTNCDGRVNAIDAALVLQLSAGLITELPCSGGDVNGDGRVDAIDASLILQYVAGLITALPPPH
jgi:hypothetical protein